MLSRELESHLSYGQSMIEVIISVGVAVILAVSLITTSLVTQRSARSARNNAQATKLVQQNLEQVRIFRDRQGFDSLPQDASCYTLGTVDQDPQNWQFYTTWCSTDPQGEVITLDNTAFFRKIAVSSSGADKKLIAVTVSWTESGGTQSVVSQTILSSWENFP